MRGFDRYREGAKPEPETPSPTETHVRVVGFIDEMVTTMLGQNTALTPMVRVLQRMRPALLRDLATIPEDSLKAFMVDLGRRMALAGDPRCLAPGFCSCYREHIGEECDCPCHTSAEIVPVPVSVFGYGGVPYPTDDGDMDD